jgi:cytochrome c biogenesis protein
MDGLIRWLHSFWKILGSRRLAVILLGTLPLALLLISLFPQMPAEPRSQEMWLEAANLRYGPATGLLKKLGMFDAYHSLWFLALLAALLLNTLICTLQRLRRLWRSLTEPPVIHRPEAFYQGSAHGAQWTLGSLDQGLPAVRDILGRHRFHPQVEHDESAGCASLYAERGRWSQAGTLVSHFAAVVLLVAVACRPALGWQESNLTLLPGDVYHIGHGHDLDVRAGQLITEHPLRVPLVVLKGTSAITHTLRLNRPLTFGGISLHLQSYGPAVQITAPEGTFGAAFSGSQAQEVILPEAGFTLRVSHRPEENTLFVETLVADGRLFGSGSVSSNQAIEIEGIPITFSLTNYTVWQVSRDPTFRIAVTSAVLLLVGVVISLWVQYRRLWLRVDDEGRAHMVGAGDWGEEFDTIATEIARTCCPQGESDG